MARAMRHTWSEDSDSADEWITGDDEDAVCMASIANELITPNEIIRGAKKGPSVRTKSMKRY